MSDFSSVLIPGPWSHDFVTANGARFHVAQAGPCDSGAPLVLFLHSFPQFWWAWRHQMEALAAAGYRAVAMDLRGVGASDKPPSGYDIPTRTRDAAGVIRSLGAHSAPHPARIHQPTRSAMSRAALARLAFYQLPLAPERAFTQRGLMAELLQEMSGDRFTPAELDTYTTAIDVPFAAHNSLEAMRWLVRSKPRTDGRRFLTAVRKGLTLPTLQIHGADDGVLRAAGVDLDGAALSRDFRFESIPDSGHFVPEHAPETATCSSSSSALGSLNHRCRRDGVGLPDPVGRA